MNDDTSSTIPSKPSDLGSASSFERLLIWLGIRHAPSIREDIEDALAEADIGAEFSQRERDMLKNVLGLRTNRIQNVMVPRADVVAVGAETSLGELLRVFRTAGHSRLPVYGETLDDPRGMVHIPDLGSLDLSVPLSAAKILRPVLFVPPSMLALDLLVKMQTTRTHMALVIDEYGGTDGLVSIEDLVEIVVGEIEDEHDLEETPMIVSSADGTHVVDARADLKEVSAVVGVDLSQGEDAEEIETIGGLVGMLAGRVPVRGQIIPGPGTLEFEVLDADPRRVKRVRIQQKAIDEKEHPVAKRRRKAHVNETPPDNPSETGTA